MTVRPSNPAAPFADKPLVSPAEWRAARLELLAEEKRITRELDALAAKRRALPWERVEKTYIFQGPDGPRTLDELFRGQSQLIVQHFMLGPGQDEGCSGCSHLADHSEAARVHFEARDVAFAAISRAPWAEIAPFQKRMGWTFPWYSSAGTDFNYDYEVAFTPEQIKSGTTTYNYGSSPYAHADLPGVSVFAKDERGQVFHTYSAFARGCDALLASHTFLDMTPKGRNETLPDGTFRLRHHDRYEALP
jgi:predicted dithiol-disulfide oxidoreductase (DUF899 family)